MTSSSAFGAGDIVTIEFPKADGAAGKEDRPCLVISGPTALGDYCIAMISSQKHDDGVSISSPDLAQGNLNKASFVRVRRLYTFEGSLVTIKRAALKPAAMARVMNALCPALGCKS
jgi:mRNA-degrading endonuclease toxin of MazEF toxin-antitoxin module